MSSTRSVGSSSSFRSGGSPFKQKMPSSHFNNGGQQQHPLTPERYSSGPGRLNSSRSNSGVGLPLDHYSSAPNHFGGNPRNNGPTPPRNSMTHSSNGDLRVNAGNFPQPYFGQNQQVGTPHDPYRNDPQSVASRDPYRNDQPPGTSHDPYHHAPMQHGPTHDRGPQEYTNSANYYRTGYAPPHTSNEPRPSYTAMSQQNHRPDYNTANLDNYAGAQNPGVQRQNTHGSYARPPPGNQNNTYSNPHARAPNQYNMPYGDAAMPDHQRAHEEPRYVDNTPKPEMHPSMHKCVR